MNSGNRPLRIAVADDDPRLRDYFKRALSLLGHQVVALAADGDELLAACLKCQPDLILTDLQMPRMNGVEAIRRIWQVMAIPAIVITGLPDRELFASSGAQQAPQCLLKPVPLAELRQAISRAALRGAAISQRGAAISQMSVP